MNVSDIRFGIGKAYNRSFNATSEFWGYADDEAYKRAVKRSDRIKKIANEGIRNPTAEAFAKVEALADRHVRIIANALRRMGYQFADPDECDSIEVR